MEVFWVFDDVLEIAMRKIVIILVCSIGWLSGKGFVDRMDEGFLKKKPRIGEKIPEISGFDLDGKEFPLSQVRGKWTVVVCGCFT